MVEVCDRNFETVELKRLSDLRSQLWDGPPVAVEVAFGALISYLLEKPTTGNLIFPLE